jgi:hypothetical protein
MFVYGLSLHCVELHSVHQTSEFYFITSVRLGTYPSDGLESLNKCLWPPISATVYQLGYARRLSEPLGLFGR